MRKYKEELVARLQNDSKSVMEDGVEFIVKPIPEIEKTSGMDPRMLKAAKRKNQKFANRNFRLTHFNYMGNVTDLIRRTMI